MPRVEKDIIVNAPSDTVYQIWRNFENFPNFMENIDDVRTVGHDRTHWKSKGPLGQEAEWDAEMTVDDPGHAIGWSSIEGSSVQTAGRVDFIGEDGVTHVHVELQYDPPGGTVGAVATRVFSNPEKQVEEDLLRFKDAAERGREFSGFNYYMPEDTDARPNHVQERAAGTDGADDGEFGEAVEGPHDPAVRNGKTSTKTGTPGGALGTPTPDQVRTREALYEKGRDVRADKNSWG